MPRPRFAKLDPEKQHRILEAAMEEFAAHGFEGASYNRIIEKAEVSKGAMYYYFDDKEDLYVTVVQGVVDHVTAELDEISSPTSRTEFWRAYDEMIERISSLVLREPNLAGLIRSVRGQTPSRNEAFRALERSSRQWIKSWVRAGRELGAVRTDIPEGLLVSLLAGIDDGFDGWLVTQWEQLTPEDFQHYVHIAKSIYMAICEPPTGAAVEGGER